jgi:hypothetical protein
VGEKFAWGPTSVKRVLILVEGQTEETFVRDVLTSHLMTRNIYPISTLVATKVVKVGANFKGGLNSYGRAKKQILNLLGDTSAIAVTPMFDLYGLPTDFPGYQTRPLGDCYAKTTHLENALSQDIGNHRFRPYLQIHEFEAFLFVSPKETAARLPGSNLLDDLVKIKAAFNSSEEINDNPNTAPSKRLIDLFPQYQKTLHGPLIAKYIGLEPIRQECPHFNQWLTWLEELNQG